MPESFDTKTSRNNPQEEQRVYAALLVVAVAALFLGVWQLRNNIRLPFIINTNTSSAPQLGEGADEPNLLALKNKDTDADGLSDYDEVYVYGTSAFLADTDSDGYSDSQEITTGNNPLCPAKQTCLVAAPAFAPAALAPRTTAELRALLKQQGVSDEQLAAIDDQTLLKVYGEVSAEVAPPTNGSTEAALPSISPSLTGEPPPVSLTEEEKQLLRQMSGAELRTYLKQTGIQSADLDKIDDATLKVLVTQTLGL